MGPSEQKRFKNLRENGAWAYRGMERGRIEGLPKFFEYPLLSQERIKLRTSNLAGLFTGPSEQKPFKNLRENGAWAYRGTAQIF